MAEWLEQASQWHEKYCHDREVMSSNPGQAEFGVRSTFAYVTLEPKVSYLLWGEFSICALCYRYDQSLQLSFLVPPGTHHCWVDRGGMLWEASPTPLYMAGSLTRAPVTHPSTNQAMWCLISAIWWELATTQPCATMVMNSNPGQVKLGVRSTFV